MSQSTSAIQGSFVHEFCDFLEQLKKHIQHYGGPALAQSTCHGTVLDQLYTFVHQSPFLQAHWSSLGLQPPIGAQQLVSFIKSAAARAQEIMAAEDWTSGSGEVTLPERFVAALQVVPRYCNYWDQILAVAQDKLPAAVSEQSPVPAQEVVPPVPQRSSQQDNGVQFQEIADTFKMQQASFLGKLETLVRSVLHACETREHQARQRQQDILAVVRNLENDFYNLLERVVLPLDRELLRLRQATRSFPANSTAEDASHFMAVAFEGLWQRLKNTLVAQKVYVDEEVCAGALFDENKAIVQEVVTTDRPEQDGLVKAICSHAFYRLVEGEREYLHMADVITYAYHPPGQAAQQSTEESPPNG